jgi:rRNA processing protein Gar1
VPYFNAPIFLENKTQIGKVEEILGAINNVYFTVKMAEGVQASSYAAGDRFFIDPMKLLPMERFLPREKGAAPAGGRGALLCVFFKGEGSGLEFWFSFFWRYIDVFDPTKKSHSLPSLPL